MDTPQLIRQCGWRFCTGRFLNSAKFGADWTPYAASMAIKGFWILKFPKPISASDSRALWREILIDSWPAWSWQFGRVNYEPGRFAYDAQGNLHPFDPATQTVVEESTHSSSDFWDFVQKECLEDETNPQVFGECVRCRLESFNSTTVFVRFAFNHALVDGIMIFKWAKSCESLFRARGGDVLEIELERSTGIRTWRSARTEYSVEDLTSKNNPRIAKHGNDYSALLFEIMKRHTFSRNRQVIATPRDALVQIAFARIPRAGDFETFKKRNETIIREAQSGTFLNWLLDYYKGDGWGNAVMKFFMSDPPLLQQITRSVIGDLMVSAFMFRHRRYLVFPVVHALQTSGIAMCNVWTGDDGQGARLTAIRQLDRPRPGNEVLDRAV